ncbi:MAG TPA: cytochrome c [Burkholderiaceae bacterium]|jgi:cytochrome c556|nr:cytochrome c [Burkholderiaceae bacterium]
MNHVLRRVGAAALIVSMTAASAAVLAQQAPKPEQLIKWRQSAFQVVAWNNARIKASLDGTYNKEEVVKAANTIAAIANGGLGNLFAPGSDHGKGWHDTSAKPELFQEANGKHAGELVSNFGKEANELARVASAADAAGVKDQFAKLNKTCKACHDDFKAKD